MLFYNVKPEQKISDFIIDSSDNRIFSLALQLGHRAVDETILSSYTYNLEIYARTALSSQFSDQIKRAEAILNNLDNDTISFIPFYHKYYPALLRELKAYPFGIFIRGKTDLLLAEKKLSIVGTRNPSLLSILFTEWLADYLSSKGITVVSGFALGIDTAAHRLSIASKGGTIGVLAHGLDFIYPKANFDLFSRCDNPAENILLISEHPPGAKPLKFHFPKRNAVIAGISAATFHIEGGIKSGAGITVKHGLDAGREIKVFDHPHLKNNAGGRRFIEDGAENISNYCDIIIENERHINVKRIKDENYSFIGNGKYAKIQENENSEKLIPRFLN